MYRIIISIMLSIFITTPSIASEVLKNGTLQAYWAENWNDEGTINKPYLGLRYLTADKNKFIVLSIKESKVAFIKKNFKNIPNDFFKRKEWYITQQGDLTVSSVKEGMLCNDYTYDANIIKFKPNTSTEPVDTALYEDTAHGGCNGDGEYPYITTFIRRDESIATEFKSAPNTSAPTIAYKKNVHIVKIRMINKNWMYAGVYDGDSPSRISPPYGYVHTKNLKIVN